MVFLSKEASNKDESLKMQMMLSMKEDKSESSTEFVWKENGSCGDQRTDLTIVKANFPEKTLVYVIIAVLHQSREAMQRVLILLSLLKYCLL